ncbi:MAG: hypothetical protein UY81_C0003G0008 [Candidatus Giovannonibacteria bacterium GW2011_GWA2_53_7]|uniref:Uncharacterized protein n=1 Tax=Candidatus Giovannonibacteria bacterium GW2011_GWA2_53_7 TaxID=1618650 RepID=A0A0G1Y135_9BACT|nr:MAG: hypothetical protein UY81_C0003G0008 [Candidatus Giovannonibacteria bacterium GW2011_GWA2_53_7]
MEDTSYQTPEVKTTETFYRRARWWIAHREGARRLWIGLWIALDVFLVVFALWMFVDTFLINYEAERGLLRSLLVENQTSLRVTTEAQSAQPVTIDGAPLVLASSEDAYDFVGFVTNPNEDWWAEFTYQFSYGTDAVTESDVAFVYPGESRAILALGVEGARPTNVKLRLLDLDWHRIDPHATPNFPSWKTDHVNLSVTNATFTSLEAGSSGVLGRSSFSVTNNSGYGYWSLPMTILLKHGSAIVGVHSTILDQFEAGETRQVDLSWFQAFPTIDVIEAVPTLNIFDASVYMPLRADRAIDTRTNFGL